MRCEQFKKKVNAQYSSFYSKELWKLTIKIFPIKNNPGKSEANINIHNINLQDILCIITVDFTLKILKKIKKILVVDDN